MRTVRALVFATLPIAERALGPEHPELAAYLANYAEALRHAKRKKEVEIIWQRAAIIRKSFAQRNSIGYTIDVSDLEREKR